MKYLPSQIVYFLQERGVKRNIRYLARFALLLLFMIAAFSTIFHYIMELEGRTYSWITGVYWTLTVMSTLGFGDVTFTSDLGKVFSIVVLLSGVIFFLVMLPFTFIQYFYAPWLEALKKDRTPRQVPDDLRGHVILVGSGPIVLNLMDDLKRYEMHPVILCGDTQSTLDLADQGYHAVMGAYDENETYRRLGVERSAMLVALDNDVRNTNIVFTVREVSTATPVTSSVESDDAIDILQLAGSSHVFQFHHLLGDALGRRVIYDQSRVSELTRLENLVVAEVPLMRSPLEGKTLRECGLRDATGINVVGMWQRGRFMLPKADTRFEGASVIVVAGTEEQIQAFNRLLAGPMPKPGLSETGPVLILGGGRVGLAAARFLQSQAIPAVIVDKSPRIKNRDLQVEHGDAADLEVLERAGIRNAPSVLITTHDDDTNIYLTIYCRRLRPDIQIITRATLDRNVEILHSAGADLVLSLASLMTSTVMNLLRPGKVFMLNEGLNLFRVAAGESLTGLRLAGSGIRNGTGCNVVAVRPRGEELQVNPPPDYQFRAGDELYLIGDVKAESAFYERFGLGDA